MLLLVTVVVYLGMIMISAVANAREMTDSLRVQVGSQALVQVVELHYDD